MLLLQTLGAVIKRSPNQNSIDFEGRASGEEIMQYATLLGFVFLAVPGGFYLTH